MIDTIILTLPIFYLVRYDLSEYYLNTPFVNTLLTRRVVSFTISFIHSAIFTLYSGGLAVSP